jgi:hypothetical protein
MPQGQTFVPCIVSVLHLPQTNEQNNTGPFVYFNRLDVQQALFVAPIQVPEWTECSTIIKYPFNHTANIGKFPVFSLC